MKKIGKAVAATLIGGAVLLGGVLAGGAVLASSSDAPSPAGATATDRPRGEGRPHLLAGAYHGDGTWLLVDGTTRSTSSDFGEITAVGEDSITIQRPDGESVTAPVDASTCIREDGQPAALSDLQPGERALVTQSNGSAIAVRAGLPPREKNRQGCGLLHPVVHGDVTVQYLDGSTRNFAYDPGRITAIEDGRVSLRRRDGQSVTLAYDDSTVVVEEGELGTIEDLSVGDGAMFFSEDGKALVIRCVISAPTAQSP